MNFTVETQGANTYLVYQMQENEKMDTLSLGMLRNNKIAGMAPMIYSQMDKKISLKYNVTSKVSVKQFFAGQVNKQRLLRVFSGICAAYLAAEEYMIDPETLVMDLAYIFADVSSGETTMICLPLLKSNTGMGLGQLFKNIIFSVQFDSSENGGYVTRIINYLNSTPAFSPMEFNKLIDIIAKEGTSAPTLVPAPIPEQPRVSAQVAVPPAKPAYIPQPVVPERSAPAPVVAQDTAGKDMSLAYLLTHYTKENKERYDRQKEQEGEKDAYAFGNISGAGIPPQNMGQVPAKPQSVPAVPPRPAAGSVPRVPDQPVGTVPRLVTDPNQMGHTARAILEGRKPAPSANPPVPTKKQVVPPPVPKSGMFGETTVLSSGAVGETTVLGQRERKEANAYLLRVKTKEKILLTKPNFKIGKERSFVDYFVADNTAISRSHAIISCKNNTYFVLDTNSTNHTYLNNEMIQSNVEMPLVHGIRLRLANEEFVFYAQ